MVRLSCADFTWPLLAHDRVLQLIHLLDLEAVDLGLLGNRSHIRPEVVRQDVPRWVGTIAERLAGAGLRVADVFVQPWSEFDVLAVNHPDVQVREQSLTLFNEMLQFAVGIGAPGITLLPGIVFGDEPLEAALARSAEGLKRRIDLAARAGLRVSVEGHLGSLVDTPAKLARLVELTPGLTLTLDYGHFTYQDIPDAEIAPLLPHARHIHCRGGARGRLQTSFAENTIDYGRMADQLAAQRYDGYVALEYVWQDWQGCNQCENTCETILFRDFWRSRATVGSAG